jgi:hypothetical protein
VIVWGAISGLESAFGYLALGRGGLLDGAARDRDHRGARPKAAVVIDDDDRDLVLAGF